MNYPMNSTEYNSGRDRAASDWVCEGTFNNPFPVGTDAYRGYEAHRNYIEYNEMCDDFLKDKLGV